MAEVRHVNMAKVPEKWQKLMLWFQNTPGAVFRCTFPDRQTAKKHVHAMESVINRHPSWFTLLVSLRGNDIYVIRTEKAQKVVILDEAPY